MSQYNLIPHANNNPNLLANKTTSNGLHDSSVRVAKEDLRFRFLCPDDVNTLKSLCAQWFPVE